MSREERIKDAQDLAERVRQALAEARKTIEHDESAGRQFTNGPSATMCRPPSTPSII